MRRWRSLGFLAGLAVLAALLIVPAPAGATGVWQAASPLATARSLHTATLLPDGRVLVVGGWGNAGGLSSAELFDPVTNSWSAGEPMTKARYCHTATRLNGGNVLVVGGTGAGYEKSAELYNPLTGTWSTVAPMSAARTTHTATLLRDGRVLVTGGYGSGPDLSSAELYDPCTDTWTAAASMTIAREEHTATLLADGRVLVVGGFGGPDNERLDSAELYDPRTDTWTAAASMATERDGCIATLLRDGRVLVTGGYGTAPCLSSAELYDPRTDTWTGVGSLTTCRVAHTATLLQDGSVLVAGGSGLSGPLSDFEVYDPVTDARSYAGSLPTGRHDHTATLLHDGRTLIAGGVGSGAFLTSADLYVPDTAVILGLTTAQYSDCVSLEATVTPAGTQGRLTFRVNGSPLGLLGRASYDATSGFGAQGHRVCLPAGDYPITARFSPDDTTTAYTAEASLLVTPEAMTASPNDARNPARLPALRNGRSGVFFLKATFTQERDGCYGLLAGTPVSCTLARGPSGPAGGGQDTPTTFTRRLRLGSGQISATVAFPFARIPSGRYTVTYQVEDDRFFAAEPVVRQLTIAGQPVK